MRTVQEQATLKEDRKKQRYKRIVLVGNPNVGKSVIFGLLTGKYVTGDVSRAYLSQLEKARSDEAKVSRQRHEGDVIELYNAS